jgi:ribonuclease P protein component
VRAARLRQTARFQAVRSQGRWWSHSLLAMGVLANDQDGSRCGFSVGKRLGKAVVRNRVRRRLREVVRQEWPHVAPGWDVVFAAREPLRDARFADIQDAVSTLLRRAHLLPPLA